MRQKGFASILLIVTFIGLFILSVFYYLGVYSGNLSPIIAKHFGNNIALSYWKTFENTNEKYSIQYPPKWEIERWEENGNDSIFLDVNRTSPEKRILVLIKTQPEIYNNLEAFKSHLEATISATLKRSEYQEYSIDGQKGAGFNFVYVPGFYRFVQNPATHKIQEFVVDESYKDNEELIDLILSTFKFTN